MIVVAPAPSMGWACRRHRALGLAGGGPLMGRGIFPPDSLPSWITISRVASRMSRE